MACRHGLPRCMIRAFGHADAIIDSMTTMMMCHTQAAHGQQTHPMLVDPSKTGSWDSVEPMSCSDVKFSKTMLLSPGRVVDSWFCACTAVDTELMFGTDVRRASYGRLDAEASAALLHIFMPYGHMAMHAASEQYKPRVGSTVFVEGSQALFFCIPLTGTRNNC